MKKYIVLKKDKKKNLQEKFLHTKTNIKSAKGRKISSSNWLQRQLNDRFVQMSKEEGYLSRAAYKIIEIIEKFPVLINKDTKSILDLGCSPGSWSQALNEITNYEIKIIGVDIIDCIYSNQSFKFIKGDFEEKEIQEMIKEENDQKEIGLIVSDISHNVTGTAGVDRIINTRIIESSLEFAKLNLAKNGCMVVKSIVDSYQDTKELILSIFRDFKIFKPISSRKESSEKFIICIGKR